jgi:hypothetical protein
MQNFSVLRGSGQVCPKPSQCILIVRRHKRRPPHQNSLRSMLCFRRLRTTKVFEKERRIALYQKAIVIALWAKSETTTSEYSSFSKSTNCSSRPPESLKTLAPSSKDITHPAMITCCGANQNPSFFDSCLARWRRLYYISDASAVESTSIIFHASFGIFPLMAIPHLKIMCPVTLWRYESSFVEYEIS